MGDDEDIFQPAGTTGSGTSDDPYVMPEMPIYPESASGLAPGEVERDGAWTDNLVVGGWDHSTGSGTSDDPYVMPELEVTPEGDGGS